MFIGRPFLRLLAALCIVCIWASMGYTRPLSNGYTVDQVPNVQLTDSTQFVTDPVSVLDALEKEKINNQLHGLKLKHGIEAVVVILPNIHERYSIEGFALELLRSWGLGNKKANNGLLLLVDMGQRAIRFEVGYGLEGLLPDATLYKIIDQTIIPEFRSGREGEGISMALDQVAQIVGEGGYPPHRGTPAKEGLSILWAYLFFMGIATILLVARLSSLYKNDAWSTQRRIYEIQSMSTLFPLLALLFLPGFLLLHFYKESLLMRLSKNWNQCPQCLRNHFSSVSPQKRAFYLDSGEQVEQSIGSREYLLWLCQDCGKLEKKRVEKSARYKVCPHCGYKTAQKKSIRNTINGTVVVTYHCLYCHRDHTEKRRDSGKDLLIMGALLGSTSRPGGWGGGFSGGGFGGGTGGGGGATGRF